MNMSITSRHMTLSQTSRRLVALRLAHLTRYFRKISRIWLTVEPANEEVRTNLQIHARSGYYRATVVGPTIGDVVTSACDMVARQRRIHKRVLERTRRHSDAIPGRRYISLGTTSGARSPEDFGL
jgi:ribosome-associated translation inhibitor RaiA